MRKIIGLVAFVALAALAWHLVECSAINEDLRTHSSGWVVRAFSDRIVPDGRADTTAQVKREVLAIASADTTEKSLNQRARRRFDVYAMVRPYKVRA